MLPTPRFSAAVTLPLIAVMAHAQTTGPLPGQSRPLRLIAMSTGFPENAARILGAEFAEMGRPRIVVEPKPGANGILAAEYVARSAPDGHTILIGTNSTHAANQTLYEKLPYDYVGDFAPVSGIAKGMVLLVTHPQVPAKSVRELTALAKKQPDGLTFASGSSVSLAAVELYKMMAGIKLRNIPYKTVPQGATDLIAGRVDLMMANLVVVLPHVKTERLRALAISSAQRWPAIPEVPTMHEAGVTGYEWTFWNAAWLPAGTPKDVVAKTNELFVNALARPRVKEYFANVGSIPYPSSSDELMKFQIAEQGKWRRVIQAAGIKPE